MMQRRDVLRAFHSRSGAYSKNRRTVAPVTQHASADAPADTELALRSNPIHATCFSKNP
jgi:hypothetical protein